MNEKLDAGVLAIASLTDLPRQAIEMNPATSFLGAQIQQIKTSSARPVVDSTAPLIITRRSLGNGQLQYRVQFIAPTQAQDPNYRTTSVLLQTPNGTVRLAASAGQGPIVFNSQQTSAPGSVVLEQSNTSSTSDTGLGTGNSRALVQA